MKKISLLLILTIIIAVGLAISCEPDDICPTSTSTTPKLIIELYDFQNQQNRKAVSKLLIRGVDNDNILNVTLNNKETSYDGIAVQNIIYLPLKTDSNTTQYRLTKDTDINNNGTPDDKSDDFPDGNTGNTDVITINYTREDVYVSRACGYKTIYKNVSFTIEPDSDNWIKSSQLLNDNQSVEDEKKPHFNIFH